MAKTALFIECGLPLWVEVAARLRRDRGWEIPYWTGWDQLEGLIAQRLPGTIFFDGCLASRGLAPRLDPPLAQPALEPGLVRELAYHQAMTLKMMDRMDPGGDFSHEERMRLYFRLLTNALALLERFKPDAVVMGHTPHGIYDYVLYALARHLGIETLTFTRTGLPRLIYLIRDLEEPPRDILARYRELIENPPDEAPRFPEHIEAALAKAQKPYEQAMPHTVAQKMERLKRGKPQNRREWIFHLGGYAAHPGRLLTAGRELKSYLTDPPPADYSKVPGRLVEDHRQSGLGFRLRKRAAARAMRRLERHYESLCRPLDLNAPFIYVALQAQPEKSTSPDSGIFTYQQLMLRMLSELAPEGWRIYVKEHLVQFKPFIKGERGRWPHYYEDIAKMPRVSLTSLSVTPFDLIDRCQAVATTTGSTGWEALLRGKPAMIFGHTCWYRGCQGTFDAFSLEQCRRALEQIERGVAVDPLKVRLFVQAFLEKAIQAWTDRRWEKLSGIPLEENARVLAQVLDQALAD